MILAEDNAGVGIPIPPVEDGRAPATDEEAELDEAPGEARVGMADEAVVGEARETGTPVLKAGAVTPPTVTAEAVTDCC